MLLLWKIKKPVTGKDVLFFKHIKLRTGGESLTTLTAIFIFLLLLGKRVILGEEPKNGFPIDICCSCCRNKAMQNAAKKTRPYVSILWIT